VGRWKKGIEVDVSNIGDDLEGLSTGVRGDAEVFGLSPARLARRLVRVAENYRAAIAAHEQSQTRGELLKQLAHVESGGDEDFALRISALGGEALDTVFGSAPGGGLKLFGRDEPENRDVLVPGIERLEVAAIKKLFAAQARGKVEGDIAAARQRTGFEFSWGRNWTEESRNLRQAAESQPALAKRLFVDVIGKIRKTFRIGENGAGGLNQKVNAGLVQPFDWQLIIGVLDEIWPVEKGQMPTNKRTHARQIIDQVIIFARGEAAAIGRKPGRDHRHRRPADNRSREPTAN